MTGKFQAVSVPTFEELWRRIERADDLACHGTDDEGGRYEPCVWCKAVLEELRGGKMFCPGCKHINALGHSCGDWKAYDAGEIDLDEVTRRSNARDRGRGAVTQASVVLSITDDDRDSDTPQAHGAKADA